MSNQTKDSFVFYRSFHDAIQDLSDPDKLLIYDAITQYALDRIEPDLQGFPKTIFKLIRPQIDANWRRYENGTKGGAPTGNRNALKQPKNNRTTTKPQPNVNDNGNVNEKENGVPKGTSFVPPSLTEFESYFIENGYSAEMAKRAYTGYDVAGWKDSIGKPIRNWKQKCVHVWFKPENNSSNSPNHELPPRILNI